jgi:23S rRNA (adenine2503-C2)-methyltransferase
MNHSAQKAAAAPVADIRAKDRDELVDELGQWGQPAYRVDQLLKWLYTQRVTNWESMTNLPGDLRQGLGQRYTLRTARLLRLQGAPDATRKFLWQLHDQALIESVLIPASPALYGEPSDRHTLCISTQVGCAYGCKFCASGLAGWRRNLSPDEIVEQVLGVERWGAAAAQSERASPQNGLAPETSQTASQLTGPDEPKPPGKEGQAQAAVPLPARQPGPTAGGGANPARLVNNLVVMGMGEPLANYNNLLKALRLLNAPWGGAIGARKITVSTSGLAPQIRQLAEEPLQLRLAVSLHAATNAVRNRLMPVNRKYPLRELVAACEYYQTRKGRMITLEYILIAGVNDALDQARGLAALAGRLQAKVNLIPYNPVEGLAWQRPREAVQQAFLAALLRQRIKATLRVEKGLDIDAACGQLRLKTEREMAHAGHRQSAQPGSSRASATRPPARQKRKIE